MHSRADSAADIQRARRAAGRDSRAQRGGTRVDVDGLRQADLGGRTRVAYALQRQAGNSAVRQLLARHTQGVPGAEAAAAATAQRQADDGADGGGADGGGGGGCPATFCAPMPRLRAIAERHVGAPLLLAGIAVKVNSRVVGLWQQHIFGGRPPQDLSSQFAGDFTASLTTATVTDFLLDALQADLAANPPTFPPGQNTITVDLPSRIGAAIAEIGDPASGNAMDFDVIDEIPGNIAGGIGTDQTTHPVGAQPSPFNDSRTADGTATVTRNPDGSLTVVPAIRYTVRDTIDLCPGNCGTPAEQVATVPLSRWEASGISGDVPFTVVFPAPPRTFTVTPSAPPPAPPPAGPVPGVTTASSLRIRQTPTTSAPILGHYPRGSAILVLCQTPGTVVEGNEFWDRTDRGFVSDRYVNRTGPDAPPAC